MPFSLLLQYSRLRGRLLGVDGRLSRLDGQATTDPAPSGQLSQVTGEMGCHQVGQNVTRRLQGAGRQKRDSVRDIEFRRFNGLATFAHSFEARHNLCNQLFLAWFFRRSIHGCRTSRETSMPVFRALESSPGRAERVVGVDCKMAERPPRRIESFARLIVHLGFVDIAH